MKFVIQRVNHAEVKVDGEFHSLPYMQTAVRETVQAL